MDELFAGLPALMLVGARATGKTTTARRRAAAVVRLDRDAEAAAFRADPDAALAVLPRPILLDEWQEVPSVLGAVKRAVDEDADPGSFLLTGSVHATLTEQSWPGTGRVLPLRVEGLTERELAGRTTSPSFLERLIDGGSDPARFGLPADPPDLRGYVELALRGGYPEPVLGRARQLAGRWLEGYVAQLLTHDVASLDGPRDPVLLRRYFEAVALNTAGLPTRRTIAEAVGIDVRTVEAYDRLLANLFVLDFLPAWSGNRLKRLARGAKRYLADPALMAAALDLDVVAVMRNGDLLGRLIETFVLAQLRPETHLGARTPRLHHVRDRNGRHEVDVVAEVGGRGLVALEVKASAAPTAADARHIEWLRDEVGDRLLAGAVLHTGRRAFRLTENVLALPICAIWGG